MQLNPLKAFLDGLAVDTLQWSLGLFCALVGAFMLVAPHQFGDRSYAFIAPYLAGCGLIGLAAGIALLSVPVTRPGPTVTAVVHGVVGLALLGLGLGFARAGAWNGFLFYTVLGLGTALAGPPAARRSATRGRPPGGDLLALLLGIAATLAGFIILTTGATVASYYLTHRALVPYFGGLWIVAGPLLVWAQVRPLPPRLATAFAHVLCGLSFLGFGLAVALPGRAWTGIALYCGCGMVITFLPWLRPLLAGVDSAALRTRLSLALALATSVALILAVAVVTDEEE